MIELTFNKKPTKPEAGDLILVNFQLEHAIITRKGDPLIVCGSGGEEAHGKIPLLRDEDAESCIRRILQETGAEGLVPQRNSVIPVFVCFELIPEAGHVR